MQKAELTKRIAETGAMAIVRVETIERENRNRKRMSGRGRQLS